MKSPLCRALAMLAALATNFHTSVQALPLEGRQTQAAGYLAAAFLGNVPSVFLHLASPQSPSTFSRLNGGQPSLVPTKGTKGARDPFILFSQDKSKLWVLATDLDIGKTNWSAAQTNGSRSIFVWESTDGVNWSQDRLVELMPPNAGYVWAPSAIWDVDRNAYAVFWSSRTYQADDPAHLGPSQGPFIFYSHTSDFVTFTTPARWEPNVTTTYIDQEIQYLGGETYIRYISDTANLRIVLDRSDTGLFGQWNRVGRPVDKTREGAAAYRDILNPSRYYLWEDNYTGGADAGYECYYTETFTVPYTPCDPALTPKGMRHGGVVQIESGMYEALQRNFVQALSNPLYLNHLAAQKWFDSPEFVAYLKYLQYFKEPKYIKYLSYPGSTLKALELLQQEQFRKDILIPETVNRMYEEGLAASGAPPRQV
ncbi:hypothetical protein KVT40_000413 [Elsinoe batatas]|uniref:Mediator of RNA polymerase II transcription subunit 31 n=1 Tax=Elsinoe batatas TaxID=2601811 RepID=A0A8K0PL45_9PEZI|nr:hypothetical protein KVT40_000413 [Elsinoe batatas]